MTHRLSVNINERTAHELQGLRLDQGITYTEAVRRAIEVFAFLRRAMDEGAEVHLVNKKTKTETQVTFL